MDRRRLPHAPLNVLDELSLLRLSDGGGSRLGRLIGGTYKIGMLLDALNIVITQCVDIRGVGST